jgi:hypothetical protein
MSKATGPKGPKTVSGSVDLWRVNARKISMSIQIPGHESFVINRTKGQSGYDLLDKVVP